MTLRDLAAMAEARTQDAWSHTSALLALLANVHRDPKKHRVYKPADFDPTSQRNSFRRPRRNDGLPKVDIAVLKQVFVDRQPATSHRKESS